MEIDGDDFNNNYTKTIIHELSKYEVNEKENEKEDTKIENINKINNLPQSENSRKNNKSCI